jgi:hypothetical protein
MSDERPGTPAPDADSEEPALPDPHTDPSGALDALEERVLGAPRDRLDEDGDDEPRADELGEDAPDPRPDEPPS